MSLFRPMNIACPSCGELVTMPAVGSVNADRRPDFRDAILDSSFQNATCGACGDSFRLQPNFNYLDAGNQQWIAGLPANRMPDYLATEDEVTALFDTSYGKSAPKAAQDVGDSLDVRVTFGWPAMREKIFIRQNGLDDIIIEMLKLDFLRRLPKAPLAPGTELRLVGIQDDELRFHWVDSTTETVKSGIAVLRSAYDSIASHPDAFAKLRSRLETGPFIDMQKFYMGEGRAA